MNKPLRCFDHDHAKHKESGCNSDRDEYQNLLGVLLFPVFVEHAAHQRESAIFF